MSNKIASALTCLLATASPAAGFVAPSTTNIAVQQRRQHGAASSSLQAASAHATEDSYPSLLNSASLCANSDTCSIESAELYLKEIVHIQSGCAAGTLSGNDTCDDVLGVSAVVADLRRKIGEEGTGREVVLRSFSSVELLGIGALYTVAAISTFHASEGVVPFTAQEVWWAIRDGYAGDLATHMLHNGGLAVGDAMSGVGRGVVPFTAQEVWWAVRDGYAGDLASHMFRNGGLAVGDAVASSAGSLSPQEVMWSIRDGYAGDTVFGATGGGSGVETVPFTPQEVWWAVRDGYALDMAGHWFRNGGLTM